MHYFGPSLPNLELRMLATLIFLSSLPKKIQLLQWDNHFFQFGLNMSSTCRWGKEVVRCEMVPLSLWSNPPGCKSTEHPLWFVWTRLRTQVSFTEHWLLARHKMPEAELERLRQRQPGTLSLSQGDTGDPHQTFWFLAWFQFWIRHPHFNHHSLFQFVSIVIFLSSTQNATQMTS